MRTTSRSGSGFRWALPWALLAVCGGVVRAEKAPSPDSALERLGRGDAVGARRDYEALLSKKPDDARLAFNAGLAAYRHEDWEGASRHFESALGSTDLQLQQRAFLALGNARSRQGEVAEELSDKVRLWEDAVRQYQAALGLNPGDTDARYNLEAVQEALSRLPKPEQDPKDQKNQQNSKDQKDQKDQKDSQGQNDSKDPKQQDGSQDPKSQDQQKDGQDQKKQDDGKSGDPKSKDGQDGKQSQDPKDSRQQGMGGQDSKKDPKDGKDPQQNGKPGEKDGKDPKDQQQAGQSGKDGKQGKDSKQGQKGEDGKEGQSGEGGEEGQARQGQQGAAGRGQAGRDAGEDSVDGRMAVRFAERLLDGHKQEEKALIWRPAAPTREPQRGADGRRKTW